MQTRLENVHIQYKRSLVFSPNARTTLTNKESHKEIQQKNHSVCDTNSSSSPKREIKLTKISKIRLNANWFKMTSHDKIIIVQSRLASQHYLHFLLFEEVTFHLWAFFPPTWAQWTSLIKANVFSKNYKWLIALLSDVLNSHIRAISKLTFLQNDL